MDAVGISTQAATTRRKMNRATRRKLGHKMKVKFSREVPYIPEWNGNRDLPETDQVKATIKPMKVEDLILVMDAMGRKPGEAADTTNHMDMGRLIKEAGSIIPRYVTFTGLEDESGPVSMEDMMSFGAYMPLMAELLMECAKVSMPSEMAEGNSKQPSA